MMLLSIAKASSIYVRALILSAVIIPLSSLYRPPNRNLDEIKYRNFVKAINNYSTFSFFTVVKVKDLRTNLTKEVCTKGNFLSGAAHRELGVGYDPAHEDKATKWLMSKKDRYFEFRKQGALDNISFSSYDTLLVRTIQRKYDFNKVVQEIQATHKFSIRLGDEEMKAFAHVLFNLGYLTGENSCFGGALEYVDKTSEYYGLGGQ